MAIALDDTNHGSLTRERMKSVAKNLRDRINLFCDSWVVGTMRKCNSVD